MTDKTEMSREQLKTLGTDYFLNCSHRVQLYRIAQLQGGGCHDIIANGMEDLDGMIKLSDLKRGVLLAKSWGAEVDPEILEEVGELPKYHIAPVIQIQ